MSMPCQHIYVCMWCYRVKSRSAGTLKYIFIQGQFDFYVVLVSKNRAADAD